MKKMLLVLVMLSMMFIGGMKYKGYDFFIVNDNVAKTSIGVLYENGHKVASVTGKDLVKIYNKILKEHQEEVMKKFNTGTEI